MGRHRGPPVPDGPFDTLTQGCVLIKERSMLLGRQLLQMSAILPPIPAVSGRRIQIFVNGENGRSWSPDWT